MPSILFKVLFDGILADEVHTFFAREKKARCQMVGTADVSWMGRLITDEVGGRDERRKIDTAEVMAAELEEEKFFFIRC